LPGPIGNLLICLVASKPLPVRAN